MGLAPRPRKAGARPARSERGETALPGLAVRRTATAILRQVIEHRVSLDSLIDDRHGNPHYLTLDTRDRALARAILGAALRHRGEIQAALDKAIDKELSRNSEPLVALLHIAAAQILFLDVPDHAAVNLAVEQAAGDRRTGRARGLVNAVLRTLVRERAAILSQPDRAKTNTPRWLFERWVRAYGDAAARQIAEAHGEPPGLDLSVKRDPEAWAAKLGGVLLPTGSIRLAETGRVTELPGFAEGAWWVQDAAAALPVRLLGNMRGKRVADLCAAPGGKTAELAASGAQVTAVDISASRLKRLSENLKRLGLQAELVAADLHTWQPREPFDVVLLDAPCSSTGTIRRHPDIPWLKQETDIGILAKLQADMLDRSAAWVRPGGLLIYSTCSLEPEEGDGQVAPFLERHPDFALVPIAAYEIGGLEEAITSSATLRTLPFHSFGEAPISRGMDGFFAARFRRG